jgi:hypothetical protein
MSIVPAANPFGPPVEIGGASWRRFDRGYRHVRGELELITECLVSMSLLGWTGAGRGEAGSGRVHLAVAAVTAQGHSTTIPPCAS